MKLNRFTAVAITLLALIAFAGCKSEEKLALKFAPKKGQKFEITMHTKQNIAMGEMGNMTQEMVFDYDMEVKEKDADNNFQILTTFRHIKFNSKSGMMDVDYDSEKEVADSNEMSAIFSKIFGGMLNKTITILVDEKGKPVSLKGMSEIMQGIIDSADIGDNENTVFDGLKAQYNDDNFMKNIEGMFSMVPGKNVSVGDTWEDSKTLAIMNMKMKTDSKFVLKEIKDKTTIIGISSVISTPTKGSENAMMTIEGTQQGTIELDKTTGLPISSNIEQVITMTTKGNGTEMPVKVTGTITLTSKELK